MNISPTGWWDCDAEFHGFDRPLAEAISNLIMSDGSKSVVDLGCGSGKYVQLFNNAGLTARGLDGNPKTHKFDKNCDVADLAKPIRITPYEWVVSLETAEHIPKEYERQFLTTTTNSALKGIVLSWFPDDGHGIGHVNPRSNEWVKSQMHNYGWEFDESKTQLLRESSTLWWFKRSLLVFLKAQHT